MITLKNINPGSIVLKSLYNGPTVLTSGAGTTGVWDFYPLSMTLFTSSGIITKTQTKSSFAIKSTRNNFIIREMQ